MSLEEPYAVIGIERRTALDADHRVGIERRTARIVELWLWPRGGALGYLPGEYVLLEDRVRTVPPRSFSIANAPRADGLTSLLVTRVPGGETSTWVHERAARPRGGCRLRAIRDVRHDPASSGPALFLAAGAGLAPIRSLLEAAVTTKTRSSLTLIFSARCEADAIDRNCFADWESRHASFRFIRTLTRDAGPLPCGRVPALLPQLFAGLADHDVFIAGAPGFVLACAAAADGLGARRERVHTEVFFVEPQPWTGEISQGTAIQ